jgi:hypothetical protein
MSTFNTLAQDFLAQKRIAVVGVSRSQQDAANLIYKTLRSKGYQVFAVNPNAEAVEGDPCYPNLHAIPGGVDGVVISTKPALVEGIVRDAKQAGVTRVWMHDNTFMPGSSSEAAAQYGRDNGITVIAAGCPLMFFDFGHKCMKWMMGVMGRLPS